MCYGTGILKTGRIKGGTPWTDDPEQPNCIFFDGLGEHGVVSMANRRFIYEDVLAQIDADTTITAEQKAAIISDSLNGRWFSARLDAYYGNADLWDVEPAE